MGLLRRFRLVRDTAVSLNAAPERKFSATIVPFTQPGGIYVGTINSLVGTVTRDEAMSVPAVLRGRNLIASIATLPLKMRGTDNTVTRSALLQQIDPQVPNVVTLAQTIEDLLCESISWWKVTARDFDGFPVNARHVDSTAVSMTPPPGYPLHTLPSGNFPDGVVWVMGQPVNAADMVRFDSPNPPLLTVGARAIRRALKLAQASEMYTDDPEARAYWTPAEGADPATDEAISEMLAAYAKARREGSEAYIPAAVKRNSIDTASPVDLQLAELQKRSDLEIANLLGLDPEDLGISTTSRTYQNATDRRQDRINDTLSLYMRAITDRLSMNDVTRRGYLVAFDLADYMKADPATRANVAATLSGIGAVTVDEIREAEQMPALTSAQRRELTPKPAEQPMPVQQSATSAVTFSSENDPGLVFDLSDFDGTTFSVDEEKRTVTGLAVPWGKVARSGGRKWRFEPGSLQYKASAVDRIKLLVDHDNSQVVGKAVKTWADSVGQWGTWKVGRGPEGDRALAMAADGLRDGLSVGLPPDIQHAPDPADPSVNVITSAPWLETSLVAIPAFTDARLTRVTMANDSIGKVTVMPTQVAPAVAPDYAAFAKSIDGLAAIVEKATSGEAPAKVNPTARAHVVEPLVYSLNGAGHSFVRDAWEARQGRYGGAATDDATARLRKYEQQTLEFSTQAALRFANAGNTTDQAQIIPSGYRPDQYVGMVPQGRPLHDAMSHGTIANATPFKVPVWVGSADLSGTNVEGTGPSTGTITDHTYRTVTPTAQSGEFTITRELVDASNPAIDQIALAAMREEYAQDTEGIIATALAAATDNDTGSGQSTEGCYVYAVTGTGNDLAISGVRTMEAAFPAHRFIAPNRLLASPTGFTALVTAVDDVGRPMFPFLGAQNAMGTTGTAAQSLMVDGLACPNAWSMTSTYDDVVLFNSVDAWVWESGLLSFRFEEKSGPENIVLNIWGYHAFQILRYTGIHACNYTSA